MDMAKLGETLLELELDDSVSTADTEVGQDSMNSNRPSSAAAIFEKRIFKEANFTPEVLSKQHQEATEDKGTFVLNDNLNKRDAATAKQTMQALEDGACDPRGALAQKIVAGLTDEQKSAYKAKSHKAKEEYRLKWCQENISKWTSSKTTKSEGWRKVDFERGTYRYPVPFSLFFRGQPFKVK